jgi:uncharacterized protein (DUF433 family)
MTDRVVITADMLSGKPRIAGTRIGAAMILEDLAAGMTISDIVDAYPQLTAEDVRAALAYAIAALPAEPVAAESCGFWLTSPARAHPARAQ